MSNDVCGYIEPILGVELMNDLFTYIGNHRLGIQKISKNELYNYPIEYIPESSIFCFRIGDAPGYFNAECLIDYYEYSPDYRPNGFPTDPKERLDILINTLSDLVNITQARKLVVSLTLCSQIETIKRITFSEMREIIHADFLREQGPPNTLYEIIIDSEY